MTVTFKSQATGDLVSVAARFAAADVPHSIARALCLCRMVALNKGSPGLSTAHGPSNRVRGLAVGDSFGRLVSRTLAQQFRTEFEEATAPHQFGISSACGVDGAVHLLRTMSDIDPAATITQIDGIEAFDNIRRSIMLDAMSDLPTRQPLAVRHDVLWAAEHLSLGGQRGAIPRHCAGRGRGAGRCPYARPLFVRLIGGVTENPRKASRR